MKILLCNWDQCQKPPILETGNKILKLHRVDDVSLSPELASESYLIFFDSGNSSGYLLFHPGRNEFFGLKVMDEPDSLKALKVIQKEDGIFSLDFKKKLYLYPGSGTTLVPAEFYSERLKKPTFDLNFDTSPTESVETIFLEELKAYFLFSVPGDLLYDLGKNYGFDRILHPGASFLSLLNPRRGKNTPEKFMALDISPGKLMVSVWEKNQLQIFSIYEYGSDEELLYMVIAVSNEFGIDPHSDKYYISGNIYRNSDLYGLIYKFLKDPELRSLPENFSFTRPFEQIPSHFYYSQTGTVLICE